jgi:hypothetical protein
MYKSQFQSFDLEAEKIKLRSVIKSRNLGGLANDTKWKELVTACCEADWSPHYRCKCIDSDSIWSLYADWYAIPFPLSAIEWLDIYYFEHSRLGELMPIEAIDHSAEVESILKAIGFDYEKGTKAFRIFGYAPRNQKGFL